MRLFCNNMISEGIKNAMKLFVCEIHLDGIFQGASLENVTVNIIINK